MHTFLDRFLTVVAAGVAVGFVVLVIAAFTEVSTDTHIHDDYFTCRDSTNLVLGSYHTCWNDY